MLMTAFSFHIPEEEGEISMTERLRKLYYCLLFLRCSYSENCFSVDGVFAST